MLRNAACLSFQGLGSHEERMLGHIRELSPHRHRDMLTTTVAVSWKDLPALSQHDDFFWAVLSLLDRARTFKLDSPSRYNSLPATVDASTRALWNRAISRNKSYYPSDFHVSEQSSPVDDVEYKSRDVINHISGELASFRTSWSLWNGQPSLDHMLPGLWRLMESLESIGSASRGVSPRYSREWFSLEALSNWLTLYNLCRNATNRSRRNLRIQLSFSLSAAAYIHSEFSYIVAVIMTLALDGRCRHLNSPPQRVYRVSNGLNPELTRIKSMISECKLTFSLITAQSLFAEETGAQDTDSLREKYNAAIEKESLIVAESILHKWPNYQSVDFREQWFNKTNCKRLIKRYVRSIPRNIQLSEYILKLQSILQHYENVARPSGDSYVFSPQFITSSSKLPSYSLRDVLISHINFPVPAPDGAQSQGLVMPPTVATQVIPPPAGSGPRGLGILIEELQRSQQPLLQLYGAGLNKSHRELFAQNAPKYMPVGGAVPSHEVLLMYHNECSRKKDKLFSEILSALAPSQNLEVTSSLAGIWPRITPRSILRQLAHDRINTLPDQWRLVIMCYAVTFLKYQQSLCMLELSSRRKHEELLQEIEAIHRDILAESTPDWLLIQVRSLLF
jgi:hypothetical protein